MRNVLGSIRTAALTAIVVAGAGFALAQPAYAWEDGNAGYGGVHGWGGLYQESHDDGHFPQYVYCGPRYFWQPAAYSDDPNASCRPHYLHARHRVVVRHHVASRHHAVSHCPPKRRHCLCR